MSSRDPMHFSNCFHIHGVASPRRVLGTFRSSSKALYCHTLFESDDESSARMQKYQTCIPLIIVDHSILEPRSPVFVALDVDVPNPRYDICTKIGEHVEEPGQCTVASSATNENNSCIRKLRQSATFVTTVGVYMRNGASRSSDVSKSGGAHMVKRKARLPAQRDGGHGGEPHPASDG